MGRPTADELIARLGLAPLPREGGYFRETWRSAVPLAAAALPPSYGGARRAGTAIYYLLTRETFSALHRLRGDEVFHFYLGDTVEQWRLTDGGVAERVVLGCDVLAGEVPQAVVPAGTWQASRLVAGGRLALLGTTMAPGFDFADYEHGDGEALARRFPSHAGWIRELSTRG
jgi:hypothetical protein